MMRLIFLIIISFFAMKNSFSNEIECGAFFFKKGITAHFPILEERASWEWYKKLRPEYVWIAETGFYANNEFKGSGFGFAINIGSANLESTPTQRGTIEDLVRFSSKNAFLTKESEHYLDNEKKEMIQFKTLVVAKVVEGESIGVGLVDPEAVKIAKTGNPTHMKLRAMLPEEDESYTCYPPIETITTK